jgi:hypothetical protein
MWIIFRDSRTPFNHIDRFVVDMVEDDDIVEYQVQLAAIGGRVHEVRNDVYFLQSFFSPEKGGDYFARKYKTWRNAATVSS